MALEYMLVLGAKGVLDQAQSAVQSIAAGWEMPVWPPGATVAWEWDSEFVLVSAVHSPYQPLGDEWARVSETLRRGEYVKFRLDKAHTREAMELTIRLVAAIVVAIDCEFLFYFHGSDRALMARVNGEVFVAPSKWENESWGRDNLLAMLSFPVQEKRISLYGGE